MAGGTFFVMFVFRYVRRAISSQIAFTGAIQGLPERLACTMIGLGGDPRGGARITAFAQALIGSFRAFEKDVQARAARHFRPIAGRARQTAARTKCSPVVRLSDRRIENAVHGRKP
jgi:hypothetical protein